MSTAPVVLRGHCACRRVEYAVHALELEAVVCHCELCRRASGGAGMAWIAGDRATLRVYGAVHTWRLSEQGARQLCPACGSQLFRLDDTQPGLVAVAVGTLDDANAIRSTRSDFASQRPRWDARGPLGSQAQAPAQGSTAANTAGPGRAGQRAMKRCRACSPARRTQDAFSSIDPGGFITEWNPQAQATLGYRATSLDRL